MTTAASEKAGDKPAGGQKDPRITITVVYNGQGLAFEENPNEPVRALFQKALAKFHLNPDGANLFLRLGNTELPLDTKLEGVPVPDGATLYLEARRVGGGRVSR
jgi:hypothetical protein